MEANGLTKSTGRRFIDAPSNVRAQVAQILGLSKSGMSYALAFGRSGWKSQRARELVLQSGRARVMRVLPECETIHDANGEMRQYFDGGFILVINKTTSDYVVYRDGVEDDAHIFLSGKALTIRDLTAIQQMLEGYAHN